MAVLKLDSISYAKGNGPDPVTVEIYFQGGPVGAPITVSDGGAFEPFPANTESGNFYDDGSLFLYQNGNPVIQGGASIGPVEEPGDEYSLMDTIGEFIVKYSVEEDSSLKTISLGRLGGIQSRSSVGGVADTGATINNIAFATEDVAEPTSVIGFLSLFLAIAAVKLSKLAISKFT